MLKVHNLVVKSTSYEKFITSVMLITPADGRKVTPSVIVKRNKSGKLYTLEYTTVPKVFFTVHTA
jgi:hypothetical protein